MGLLIFSWFPLASFAREPIPSNKQKAVAEMHQLALSLQNAPTLTYTFRFRTNMPDSKVDIIHGFVEKPNKFRIEESVGGKLFTVAISDGINVYACQLSSGLYHKMTALKAYDKVSTKTVQEQTTDLLGNAFVPALMFFSGNPDMANFLDSKQKPTLSAAPALTNGNAVTCVSEQVIVKGDYSSFIVGFQYDLDAKTGLIREIKRGYFSRPLDQFNPLIHMSFSNFTLSNNPLPKSTFAWEQPIGTTLDLSPFTEQKPVP